MAKIIEELTYRDRRYVFKDRFQAGELLARKLKEYVGKNDAIILTIPAGGVPVGYSLSKSLALPMDIIIVRKMQVPWNTEAGFGALSWDGQVVLNQPLVLDLHLDEETIDLSILKTKKVIEERLRKFRGDKPIPNLGGKSAIVVDDGLASGFTMLAAIRSVRKLAAREIVVAVPTASTSAIRLLQSEVDILVCLNIRSGPAFAVADSYINWYDLSDDEVIEILGGRVIE